MAIRVLSAAYFVGEILIPNISGNTTTEQSNLLPLQLAMAKYEPLFLTELLGEDLYDAYVADIALPFPSTRMEMLNNMIYYTNVVLTSLNTGISPVAYYVYFYFQKNNASISLVNSEVRASHENFTVSSPKLKMINAWNEMVRLSEILQTYLEDNLTTFPEYATSDESPTEFTLMNQWGI